MPRRRRQRGIAPRVRRKKAGLRVSSARRCSKRPPRASQRTAAPKDAAPESLELLAALLEAFADVRCKAEPLKRRGDAEARVNAQRCLAVLWSRGPADSFGRRRGRPQQSSRRPSGAGPRRRGEALIMAARARQRRALPLPRLVRAMGKAPIVDRVTRRRAAVVCNAAPRPGPRDGFPG